MNCLEVLRDNLAERYVAGTLSGDEAEAFERHYFECEECVEQVELARAIRDGFASDAAVVGEAVEPTPMPIEGRSGMRELRPTASWRMLTPAIAAAAAIVLGFLGLREYREAVAIQERIVVLGAVDEVPSYVPITFRADTGEADLASADSLFEAGMRAYVSGDYTESSRLLGLSVEQDSSAAVRHYYLGASRLAAGDPEGAIKPLETAATEPLLRTESRWFAAKAQLQAGRAEDALGTLETLARGESDRADAARALRQRIRSVRAGDAGAPDVTE